MKFNVKILPTLLLSLGLMFNTNAFDVEPQTYNVDIATHQNADIQNLGHGEFSLQQDEAGNYILATQIYQGMEMQFLGKGKFSLYQNPATGEYYLVSGSFSVTNDSYLSNLVPVNNYVAIQPFRGPHGLSTPISTVVNGRTITGWWSGGSNLATVFSATTSNELSSQSMATTLNASGNITSQGIWADAGNLSSASAPNGWGIDRALWNLRWR